MDGSPGLDKLFVMKERVFFIYSTQARFVNQQVIDVGFRMRV
jgi:hypothetical protein